jgi:DNA-binding transcriptional LysR family regulator
VLSALKTRRCDVGIVQRPIDDPEFAVRELFSSPVVLAVPRAILGSIAKAPTLSELLTLEFFGLQPFIAYRHPHPFLDELAKSCGIGLNPKNVRRMVADWQLVAELVRAGHGFSIMPERFMPPSPEILRLPLSPQFVSATAFRIIALRDLEAVPGIGQFITELQKNW